MIDPRREQTVSLADAAAFVHRRFGGKKPSVNTIARWCLNGLRGAKLDSVKRGGQRMTSEEAVIRFFQQLSEPAIAAVNQERGGAARNEHLDRIDQELMSRGL